MWSASVASLRLRTTPADRLDLRERHVLASRTVTGLNLQPGWLSNLRPRQQGNPTPGSPRRGSMWDQFGMAPTTITSSISGWGLEAREAGAETLVDMPAGPSTGRWFRWSTLRTWPGWRRGQDAIGEAVPYGGELGLFVSHRWERSDHPDPQGTQFQTLLCGLSVALASAIQLKDHVGHQSASGLAELLARYLGVQLGARLAGRPEPSPLGPPRGGCRPAGKGSGRAARPSGGDRPHRRSADPRRQHRPADQHPQSRGDLVRLQLDVPAASDRSTGTDLPGRARQARRRPTGGGNRRTGRRRRLPRPGLVLPGAGGRAARSPRRPAP